MEQTSHNLLQQDECKIRLVEPSAIAAYHRPDEVFGYCKRCPKYEQFWSCPPHSFDTAQYVNQYQRAYIIGLKIQLSTFNNRDEALRHYHKRRAILSTTLLEAEATLTRAKALFSGNCQFCDNCSRKEGLPCVDQSQVRYSFESLGYKVSAISENLLDEKLQWQKGKTPRFLMSVAAILTDQVIDPAVLKTSILSAKIPV